MRKIRIAFLVFFILLVESFFFQKEIKIKEVEVIATAYYKPLKNQKKFYLGNYKKETKMNGRGITYSGKKAKIGTVAADLTIFPLGTEMFIPGYGFGVVEDVGRKIKGNRIDVFIGYGQEGLEKALFWGKRKIKIQIIED